MPFSLARIHTSRSHKSSIDTQQLGLNDTLGCGLLGVTFGLAISWRSWHSCSRLRIVRHATTVFLGLREDQRNVTLNLYDLN